MHPPRLSSSWALAALFSLVSAVQLDPTTFENTAVVRSIDLGGATTQITTSFQVRSLKDKNSLYLFSIPEDDVEKITWIEAKIKGGQTPLPVEVFGDRPLERAVLFSINLPKPLKVNDTATIILNTIQSHASTPLPATIGQNEPQALQYETGLYAVSPYETVIQRTKLRAPNPNILSYSDTIKSMFAEEDTNPVSKSGATITYGPFRAVSSIAAPPWLSQTQQQVKIRYNYDAPVIRIPTLKRSAEISHWGSNMNIQDELRVVNDGAKLKGHFSRLEEVKQKYFPATKQPYVIRDLVLHLPSGVRDPYYYDVIGNVSTSHFRPAVTRKESSPLERNSLLEFKPRYPLMGGWNYTYTQGYDLPLEEWAGWDAKKGAYVVAVPFLTPIGGAAYDEVELQVVLPEGAKIIDYQTPFPVEATKSNHVTYLDTIGRPSITFKKSGLTEKHAKLVYIVYSVDAKAHLQKPLAVAAVSFALFAVAMSFRRLDISIHTKKFV